MVRTWVDSLLESPAKILLISAAAENNAAFAAPDDCPSDLLSSSFEVEVDLPPDFRPAAFEADLGLLPPFWPEPPEFPPAPDDDDACWLLLFERLSK